MDQLPIVILFNAIGANLSIALPILLVLLGLIIGYYVLMIRAVVQMLRHNVHSVLLVFAFLCLIPFPLVAILGIVILIVWRYHKRDLGIGPKEKTAAPTAA